LARRTPARRRPPPLPNLTFARYSFQVPASNDAIRPGLPLRVVDPPLRPSAHRGGKPRTTAPTTTAATVTRVTKRSALLLFLLLLLLPAAADAQQRGFTRLDRPIRLYLDCRGGCDFNYFRTETPYIDWVRDQRDADLHVMVTRQDTGGGGTEFIFQFMGNGLFVGVDDLMTYVSTRGDTGDENRQGMLRTLQMGILPYVALTPQASQVRITHNPGRPTGSTAQPPASDRWNRWVFSTRAGGSISGEERSKNENFNGAFSANRTTEDWKANLNLDGRYNRREFTLSNRTLVTYNHNWMGEILLVRSMSDHWSAGALTTVSSSTSNNQKVRVRVASAAEYNIFPYAESNQRQFTLLYSVGATAFDYRQETIFLQTSETLVDQALNVAYELRRPWGSANASVETSHYLHDFGKNRIDLRGNMNYRIVRGLSLNFSGSAVRIRDQLYLPRGRATDDEILTAQRQLETGYRYDASIGVNYSFGSIFNTVVNPRFTGSSRRF
jgi:hypothetical protein